MSVQMHLCFPNKAFCPFLLRFREAFGGSQFLTFPNFYAGTVYCNDTAPEGGRSADYDSRCDADDSKRDAYQENSKLNVAAQGLQTMPILRIWTVAVYMGGELWPLTHTRSCQSYILRSSTILQTSGQIPRLRKRRALLRFSFAHVRGTAYHLPTPTNAHEIGSGGSGIQVAHL
eukprot:364666-Chlamydomonas_euryale.AAC.2